MLRGPTPSHALFALTLVLATCLAAGCTNFFPIPSFGVPEGDLRIVAGPPVTWDPAHAGDSSSAAVLAQVFESLTALDPNNNVQPALAQSWTVSDDGKHIDFLLRPGLHYSDGSAITAQDCVDSWLRLLDPADPSPLVSLLSDVAGASDYVAGTGSRAAIGLRAESDHVLVDLRRPAAYFVAVTSSPSLAVIPSSMRDKLDTDQLPSNLVGSGGYVATAQTDAAITFEANPNYWAGQPALATIQQVLPGPAMNQIDEFEAGNVDYINVGSFDASWIRYDRHLGPQLRQTADLSTHYYGFDTTRAPFNDSRVRRAFGEAVDWERIVRLGGGVPARSLVPTGLLSDHTTDFRPAHDPADARALLAAAGFPEGAGFPKISLQSIGWGYEVAVAAELERELAVKVSVEILDFGYLSTLEADNDRPQLWTETWVADYPHANDYLGLLLETGSSTNIGRWSNPDFDSALAAAAGIQDASEQNRLYAIAQAIVRTEVPIVPVEAFQGYALSRDGLLGALPSGAGFIRFVGLAWGD